MNVESVEESVASDLEEVLTEDPPDLHIEFISIFFKKKQQLPSSLYRTAVFYEEFYEKCQQDL